MRILMLNHEYPPVGGGSGVAMRHLAVGLTKLGQEVLVVAPGESGQDYRDEGVRVHPFRIERGRGGGLAGLRSWLSFLRRAPGCLREAADSFRPHVINSHFLFPAGLVATRTALKAVHVGSVVGADIHDPTRRISADANLLVRYLIGQVVCRVAAITTPSRDMTKRTQAIYPDVPVHTIPWGVPPIEAHGRTRHDLDLAEETFVIAALCRLVRRKRIDLLFHAVADLSAPDVTVVVMGSGPEDLHLRRLAAEMGIDRRIRFAGQVDDADKAAYLRAADVFCLPSEHEGFGLVLLESMSAGTPVITTDVGGQCDIIRDGIDGFLVQVGNAGSLRERLADLIRDRPRLLAMKREAAQRSTVFSPERAAAAFIRLFESLLPVEWRATHLSRGSITRPQDASGSRDRDTEAAGSPVG